MLYAPQISAIKRQVDDEDKSESVSLSLSEEDSEKIYEDEVSNINVNVSSFDDPEDSDEIDFIIN